MGTDDIWIESGGGFTHTSLLLQSRDGRSASLEPIDTKKMLISSILMPVQVKAHLHSETEGNRVIHWCWAGVGQLLPKNMFC